MPLVIMCGYPSSGKTTRCEELANFFREEMKKNVEIVSDQNIGLNKNDVYSDTRKEKDARGTLKAAAQRKLTRDNVVILDSLNYIKGFRYELFCMSKSANTTQCVIHCDTNKDESKKWNEQRSEEDRYRETLFDELTMRFEPPNPQQRWDSPLFLVQVGDRLPVQQIEQALFQRKAPPPNMSTQSQPLSSTNFLYELDRITQETVTTILNQQKTMVPGDKIVVPGVQDKLDYVRPFTLMELQRYKRQFITYTKMHPVDDVSKISNLFVQYLQSSIK
ncbi:protein KTI12 homolog [Liolophura sinensis]|uniref:protein KTI12 homolog n=1 Tax=Liolophura sinensis TaxID=3198878 RepID=UPI0031586086